VPVLNLQAGVGIIHVGRYLLSAYKTAKRFRALNKRVLNMLALNFGKLANQK